VKDGIRARVIAPGGDSDMRWKQLAFVHSTTYINDICILYLSRHRWFTTVGNDECSQITVEFKYNNSSDSTVHIWGECGVNLIYKQGVVCVGELNETNAPCFIESFGEVSIYKLTGKSPSQPSFSLMANPILSYFLSNYIYIWFCHWQVSQVIFLFLLLPLLLKC